MRAKKRLAYRSVGYKNNGMNNSDSVRLVVTGHDSTGKAVVVGDQQLPNTAPAEYGGRWEIWAADTAVTVPDDGTAPQVRDPQMPPPGGVKIITMSIPAKFSWDGLFDSPGLLSPELAAQFGFLVAPSPPGNYGSLPGAAGLHATPTVDCVMQVSGESVLVLEDTEVHLKPGDWLVINGVVHAWRNDGDEPAVLVGVMIGADHRGIPKR